MTEQELAFTRAGLRELEGELERLRTVRRPEVTARLQQASEVAGDLGDNLDYLDALREQEEIENRIARLEAQLSGATVIAGRQTAVDIVLGSIVELEDVDTGEHDKYRLVSSPESNPSQGRLSIDSPVGRMIAGHHAGETVDVPTPRGMRHVRIVSANGRKI